MTKKCFRTVTFLVTDGHVDEPPATVPPCWGLKIFPTQFLYATKMTLKVKVQLQAF